MRSTMRTAARTGMKHVAQQADTSISFCASQSQLGLLRAQELAPHGESSLYIYFCRQTVSDGQTVSDA